MIRSLMIDEMRTSKERPMWLLVWEAQVWPAATSEAATTENISYSFRIHKITGKTSKTSHAIICASNTTCTADEKSFHYYGMILRSTILASTTWDRLLLYLIRRTMKRNVLADENVLKSDVLV